MSARAIVFDIGGILEVGADGREPTAAGEALVARWESRLALEGRLAAFLSRTAREGQLGIWSEKQWLDELRNATQIGDADLDELVREFWDLYLGTLNVELAEWLRGKRSRHPTALLSNSFVGAREREQERYGFEGLVDLIVYSHEVGVAKPDRRIYEITCERLGLSPASVVFLDDVDTYVQAARDFGMHAVLYRDNVHAIAELERALTG